MLQQRNRAVSAYTKTHMGNTAQTQGPRSRRRGVNSDGDTLRDFLVEAADLLDRRNKDPVHARRDREVASLASDVAWRHIDDDDDTDRFASDGYERDPVEFMRAFTFDCLCVSGWFERYPYELALEYSQFMIRSHSARRVRGAIMTLSFIADSNLYGPATAARARECLNNNQWLVVAVLALMA